MNKSRKSKYELKKKIGTGSYGKVYKAYDKEEKKTVAIKIVTINKKNIKEIKSALNEVRILSSITSNYIVEYIEAFVNPSHTQFWIVMEFMGGGDLAGKIKYAQKNRTKIPESQIWNYLIQILKGIKDLNINSIIHRDIKPANIFLSEDFKQIKIGDMNVSKVLKNRLAETAIGTPYYLAPEIWERNAYDEKCDVYSLGCLIYELASLKHPFEARSTSDLHYKVKNKKIPNVPYNYSAELNYIVKKCLLKDPNKRPSAFELIDNNVLKRKVRELGYGGIFEEDKNNVMFMMDTIILPNKLSKLNEKLPNNKMKIAEKRCNSVGKFQHIDDIYNEINKDFYSKIVTPKKDEDKKMNFFQKNRFSEKKLVGDNDFEIQKKKKIEEEVQERINKWDKKDSRSNSKKFIKKKIPVIDFIKKNRKSISRKSLKKRNSVSRSKSKKKNSYVYSSQKSNIVKNNFYKRSSVERKIKRKPPTPKKVSKKLIPVNYKSNHHKKVINKNEYNSLKNRNPPPSITNSKRPPVRGSKLSNKKIKYGSFQKNKSFVKSRKSLKKNSSSRNSSVKSARYQSPRAMRYGEYMKNVAKKQREKAKNYRSL